jgi:UDP:flavonoid glycosyltransferase YjiC (YdhE family)
MKDSPLLSSTEGRPRRILFLAEAVTLAHVARPVALAQALDRTHYDVTLAVDPRYNRLLGDLPFPVRPIHSISSEQFLHVLARGSPLYDAATLRDYVREDLEVLRETAPDVVVGDFRLSLAVSARLARVPYLAITNAYWSPYARQRFPLPELPLTKVVGVRLAGCVFRIARPVAFAYHTLPLNRVRREHGLPSLGLDLRRIYTEADHVAYADVPELAPTVDLPATHHYLGPVLWSPRVEAPAWWDHLSQDRPILYVTLGSSGQGDLLPAILQALADLPVFVVAATAGRTWSAPLPDNARVADYLPGEEAAARSRLVICNGGSPTTQQALAAGVPVLGIPSNMDQYMNMEGICRAGAGVLIRAGTADATSVRAAVCKLIAQQSYTEAASRLARSFASYPTAARFRTLVDNLWPMASLP